MGKVNDSKSFMINIRLTGGLLDILDKRCIDMNMDRSTLIRSLILEGRLSYNPKNIRLTALELNDNKKLEQMMALNGLSLEPVKFDAEKNFSNYSHRLVLSCYERPLPVEFLTLILSKPHVKGVSSNFTNPDDYKIKENRVGPLLYFFYSDKINTLESLKKSIEGQRVYYNFKNIFIERN